MSFMARITASGFPVPTETSPPLLCPFSALYVCCFHFYVESVFLVVFICCSVCLWVVMGISFPRLGKFSFILLTLFSVSFTRVAFPFVSAILLLRGTLSFHGVLESLVCCVCGFLLFFSYLIYSLTKWSTLLDCLKTWRSHFFLIQSTGEAFL